MLPFCKPPRGPATALVKSARSPMAQERERQSFLGFRSPRIPAAATAKHILPLRTNLLSGRSAVTYDPLVFNSSLSFLGEFKAESPGSWQAARWLPLTISAPSSTVLRRPLSLLGPSYVPGAVRYGRHARSQCDEYSSKDAPQFLQIADLIASSPGHSCTFVSRDSSLLSTGAVLCSLVGLHGQAD